MKYIFNISKASFYKKIGRDNLDINLDPLEAQQNNPKKKMVFYVKQGLDSFLGDIIKGLSDCYEIKKIVVTEFKQIDDGLEWADLAWFEWCDELVIYASKLALSRSKYIICRLHSYEAFTDYPDNVAWENVNTIIFVSEQIRNFILEKLSLDKSKTVVIPNGIDTGIYTYKERKPGLRIAYAGYINYKKGPMLLLHTFKAIYDRNQEYQLFIAGQFQDDRDLLYYKQMMKEFGIEKNVFFEGWQDNLDAWLEDKNYILCTSLLESQNMSVMQAMAKGIKPVIHNFVGAKIIYNSEYVWNTIEDAVRMLEDDRYNSGEYLDFIRNNYSIEKEMSSIKKLMQSRGNENSKQSGKDRSEEMPLVTIGITNYNGKQYIRKCVESFLNQTYSNLEILLIDDCSTDGSKEILQEYEKNNSNIRAIYHENNSGGASKGISEIIENARGKYFQWIACDDYVQRDAIESFVNYLEEMTEKDYVYSNYNIVNEENEQTGKWVYVDHNKEEVIQHIFNTGSGLIPMNCLYRKSFFEEYHVSWIVYKENDFSADTLNSLHFIKHNWRYGRIDKALINYRIHNNNASHNLEKRINTSVALYDYIIQNFNEDIYLPQIDWKNMTDREQLKMYYIARFYYLQIENHINKSAIPQYLRINLSKDQIGRYCSIFAEEGLRYASKGLKMGDIYKVELLKIKNLLEKFLNDISDI